MGQRREMAGKELGEKLLQAVRERKAGQAARITTLTLNAVAVAVAVAQDWSVAIAADAARNRAPV